MRTAGTHHPGHRSARAGLEACIGAVWLGALLGLDSTAEAGIIEFTDAAEWQAAVGDFTTIGFTGLPDGTFITDQYADLGVLFTGGSENILVDDVFTDGAGLIALGVIEMTFETPQSWIAVDYLGELQFELYSSGELIYTSGFFDHSISSFAGLLSSVPFDVAVILDPGGIVPAIDNVHFGVPGPTSIGLIALAGLFGQLSITRSRCRSHSMTFSRR